MDRSPTRPPRRLLALVVGVTVVPLGTFLWLGWKMAAQDREIDAQQRRARLELAAERVVAALDRTLSAAERALASGQRDWPDGAVVVTFAPHRVEAAPPGRLAYLPVAAPAHQVPLEPFAGTELLEFRAEDRLAAIASYRRLADSRDRAVKAIARLRLAGNLAVIGRVDEALHTYSALADVGDVAEASVPVSLAAAWGRCSILAERGRDRELREDARRLLVRLRAGEWPVTSGVYRAYADDAARWSGGEASPTSSELLAAAVSRLWKDASRPPDSDRPRRQSLNIEGRSIVAMTQAGDGSRRVLVALASFAETEWLLAARSVAREHNVDLASASTSPGPVERLPQPGADWSALTVPAAQSNLPWTLTFRPSSASPETTSATRRQLLLAGFVLLTALWVTASVTILRSVQREMAVARLQSDFVAAVSHEFRTPLTALRQFTERLRAQPDLSQERRVQCYEAQARATDRLTKLVESVLDFGRMEAGARPYALGPHDCAELVEDLVADFRETPQAAGRPVLLRKNGTMPVDADDEALTRAVWNLLDNAAKYSPQGSEIAVDLATAGAEARIGVRDRGLGIPSAERQRLFLKFQRGEQARRLGIKGTGIGLAMVDHIVRAHAGRVEVESVPGEGSTFTIVLPLKG